MADSLHSGEQFRGLESNQHQRVQSPMSYRLDDPGIAVLMTQPCLTRFGEKGSNLHRLVQGQVAYRLADPRECPVGIEPTYLVWKTSTFATRPRAQKRKERELNPQGSSLGRFRDGCHRQLACPSVQAAAAGIEPAIISLTGSRLTIGPHRK